MCSEAYANKRNKIKRKTEENYRYINIQMSSALIGVLKYKGNEMTGT
jgi:hypothetical protein